jgi:TonB family protein
MMSALLLALALFAADPDSVATARDLYASAAYEDALAVLNRLPKSGQSADEVRTAEETRALCLIALGRDAEAQRAIEAVIAGDPAYRPASDLSPRVRTAFTDVRKRMLPTVIQRFYTDAKAAFDRKEYEAAIAGFNRMLETMADPDALAVSNQPPLSDLRTLAAGFRDLAVTAATPPPPPPVPAEPTPAPAQLVVPPAPPVQEIARTFSSADSGVTPPAVVRQDLPPYPWNNVIPKVGMIEVVIDETGAVESAVVRQSVNPRYDTLATEATKNWHYRPATLNGKPVKYRKLVQINIRGNGRHDH